MQSHCYHPAAGKCLYITYQIAHTEKRTPLMFSERTTCGRGSRRKGEISDEAGGEEEGRGVKLLCVMSVERGALEEK